MSWVTASSMPIRAYQAGGITVQYSSYRYLKGDVQIRVTDITPDYGETFTVGQILFTLRDSSGNSYGTHWCDKNWGVPGPWTQVGFVTGGKLIRLDVYHHFDVPVNFTAEMQYDQSNATG